MAHVANVSGLYGYHSLVEELGGDADQLIRKVDLDPGGIECGICRTGQLANRLGYADQAVFSRAFRRWSGMTPSQWRRENRPPGRNQ